MGACDSKPKPPPRAPNLAKAPNMKEINQLPACPVADEILGLHVMHGGPSNGCQMLLFIARTLKEGETMFKLKRIRDENDVIQSDAWAILTHCGFQGKDVQHDAKFIHRISQKPSEIKVVLAHIAAVAGDEELLAASA